MVQQALPISDNTVTNYAEGSGDGDGNAFDELSVLTDTDFWTTTNELTNNLIMNLTSLTDPESSSNHIMRSRTRKNAAGGRQIDSRHRLLESGTQRATYTVIAIDQNFTTRTDTITGGEADSITNYGNLEFDVQLLEFGGGSPRTGDCAWQEFETPNAPPPSRVPVNRGRSPKFQFGHPVWKEPNTRLQKIVPQKRARYNC
jgi:hypothetical protein